MHNFKQYILNTILMIYLLYFGSKIMNTEKSTLIYQLQLSSKEEIMSSKKDL